MEVHAPLTYCKKKMDTLFLGVSNVVPCCVLRIFGRVPIGAYDRTPDGKNNMQIHCTRI